MHPRFITILCIAFGLSVSSFNLLAADPIDVDALHQNNCLKCHDHSIYTRPERKIKSLESLHRQVQRCELGLGLTWFDDEIDAMTDYLNDRFYHFNP